MKSDRLNKRVPLAEMIGRAKLPDKRLIFFNKASNDGPYKANIVHSPGHEVWGVLYELLEEDIQKLDSIEGGYKRITVNVLIGSDESIEAYAYVAVTPSIVGKPYDWYMHFQFDGVKENGLPPEYIMYLKDVGVTFDRTMSG
jgi:gamma-glutamylcyclotransferase (GGCT)/AIG2-like uncharacterized protein YtfP